MKKIVTCLMVMLVFGINSFSHATITNGDFSDGLTGWATQGDVQVVADEAVLGDNNEWYSLLYQDIALDTGAYTIEFDVSNLLSNVVPDFTFPDTFYASLYFIDDISAFDLDNGIYDDSLALFDLDYSGEYIYYDGTVSASSKGSDWFCFSMTFQNDYNYVIPAFELFDMNWINNDSLVLLDNVNINPVPEPATILLVGSGLLGLFGIRKKQFRK
jgi:hypothetical protein